MEGYFIVVEVAPRLPNMGVATIIISLVFIHTYTSMPHIGGSGRLYKQR